MVKDSCHTNNDEGVDNNQFDQLPFTSQQLSTKTNDNNNDDIETSKSWMTCLKEILVKIFCPKCFVYPFLAVVILVVTVVMIVEYTTRDDVNITPIVIKDYTDVNATSSAPAVPTNASSLSSPPSESPLST